MEKHSLILVGGARGVGLRTILRQAGASNPTLTFFDPEQFLLTLVGERRATHRFRDCLVALRLAGLPGPLTLVKWSYSRWDPKDPDRSIPAMDPKIFQSLVVKSWIEPILILVTADPEDIFERCPDEHGLVRRCEIMSRIEQDLADERSFFGYFSQLTQVTNGDCLSFEISNAGLEDPIETLPATQTLLQIIQAVGSPTAVLS